ncbi:MAG: outer membrane protein assembly factor BamA [Reyranellaceae bacterium]
MIRVLRSLLVLAVVLSGLSAVSAPALAQRGPVITQVRITGSSRVEPDTIRSYITVREGQPFDPAEADKSLKALFQTGLFADVSVQRDGGVLLVKVIENPIINRVQFEGNRRVEDDTLRQEIASKARTVFTRAKVQSDVRRMLEVYRRGGRFNAAIEPKIIKLDQNRVDLVFEIFEGSITTISRISFVGNENFSDGRLREQIRSVESAWFRFLSSDDRYDPDRISFDKEMLRKYYLSEGYADFRVVSSVAELTPTKEHFFVTFTIQEGDRYKFGKLDVKSRFEALDAKTLKTMIVSREGDWYNADEVEATVNAITEAVGTLGYAFVDVRPHITRNKDTKTIDITFEVQEGPRVYVERINIAGNVRTLDKVIRREFRLAEGDAFNAAKLRRSQQRLKALGYFEKVDVTNRQGNAQDKTVIDVNVVEQSTGEISFGAGYSTSAGVLGDITVRERNLLGKGQDLRVGLSLGTRQTQIDLSFTEPYFLDRNLTAGFDVFRIGRDLQDTSSFDEKTIGAALRIGYALSEHTRQTFKYSFKYDKIDNVQSDASAFIKRQAGQTYTSELGTVITWDRRDDRLLPTKGWVLRWTAELGGLGGTEHYLRNRIDAAVHFPVATDFVVSFLGSGGAVIGLRDDVKISQRFFIGGDTLRGFQIAGIGPRDGRDSLGGKYFYTGTAELSFPLGLPKEINLVGKAFVEAGSLWGTDDVGPTIQDSSAIRVVAGVGLQWVSPFGPLRLDYTFPIRYQPFDNRQRFNFSFGTRF